MTTFDTVEVECPNCRSAVTFTVLMSTNFMRQDTDFRRITHGTSPRSLMLSTCGECGFTGDEEDFGGKVTAEVSELIRTRIAPVIFDESVDSPRRWEFAAILAEARGFSAEAVGWHYLNGAWCIRDDRSDATLEEYFRRKAIEKFEEHLAGGEDLESRPALTYLVGELYRRVGDQSAAARWFDDAIALADGKPELDWLTTMATRQKTAPIEID